MDGRIEGREEGLDGIQYEQSQTVRSVVALTNKRSSSVSWQLFSNTVMYSFCDVI